MLIGQVPFHADSQVGVAMKHVNEELPDVQQRRPEVSAAAALVVERATAKDPAERYQEVGEMIDDLSTALEVEAARAGSTTGEATSVLDAVPPPKRKLSGRGALVLGGDRAAGRWSPAARWSLVAAVISGGGGGGGAPKGKGATGRDLLGHRLRPPGRRRRGPEHGRPRRRRQPDRDRLEHRALRHRRLRRDQDRPGPGVGLYVTDQVAGHADEDGDPHRRPRAGTPRSSPPPPGPPDELSEWGEPVGEVADASGRRGSRARHLAGPPSTS